MGRLVVVAEVARSQCIGTLLRCASAFGADEVVIVGSDVYSTYGAHGAQKGVRVRHFFYWHDCLAFLKETLLCSVYGIAPSCVSEFDGVSAVSVTEVQWKGESVALVVPGKHGLPKEILAHCEALVYAPIPEVSCEHLVHVDAKISLCLQYCAMHLDKHATSFSGGKHAVSFENNNDNSIGNNTHHGHRPMYSSQGNARKPKESVPSLFETESEFDCGNLFDLEE